MSLYQRGKSWYYDFRYRGERYTGNIGKVSKTVAKEILAKKKAEAVEGRYDLPSKKPSPLFETMAAEYFDYYRANRRPRSVQRHEMAYKALSPILSGKRLADITPFLIEKYKRTRKEQGRSEVTINREPFSRTCSPWPSPGGKRQPIRSNRSASFGKRMGAHVF